MIECNHGTVDISDESDIIVARKTIRVVSEKLGFSLTDVTRIVTAVSELARNIFVYAGSGVMSWCILDQGNVVGIELTFEDHGPGISDLEQVMQEGYSTSKGLGLGLPGSRRLMDDIEIRSQVGEGTTVVVKNGGGVKVASSPACRLKVSHLSDASEARRMLKDMAGILGFAAKEIGDLAIVVTELVTNIVIHARDGELILTPLEEEGRLGIRIQSQDNGPGIADPDRVVTDGYSTCGGLGYGLGTVNRLMDEFIIASRPDGQPALSLPACAGTSILFPTWFPVPLFWHCHRAHLNSKFNGDSFAVTKGMGQLWWRSSMGWGMGACPLCCPDGERVCGKSL